MNPAFNDKIHCLQTNFHLRFKGQHIANKQNVNTFTKLCEKSVKLLKLFRHNCQTETANYSILKNTVSRWFKKIKLYRH